MKNFKGWRTIGFNVLLIAAPVVLTYLASVNWTDYLNPTWAPVVVGVVGILLRLVTNTPAGQKTALLLIGGSLVLFMGGARAADLAHKAPSLQFNPYPTAGCGAYYGVNALGSASPIANATPGATAIGGDIGGTLGYTCATSASTFWFVEAMADFQNLNGSGPGFALTGPAHIEERVAFGGPINQLLNVLPNINLPAVPSLPGLPGGITAGPSNGYVYAAINEDDVSATFGGATGRDWIISPELGVGMLSRLSNNVVADVWAGARLQSQEVCVGGFSCPKLSTGLVTGLAFKY